MAMWLLPHSSLEILRGAGHMGPFTYPREVNRMIVAFIRANPAGTAVPVQLGAAPKAA